MKASDQRHPFMVGIGQHVGGSKVVVVGFIFQTAIGELAQHGEAGAGAADGLPAGDIRIDGILHRRALPEVDIARLVAAGNEDRFGMADDIGNRGLLGRVAIGNDQRGHRVELAQAVDVGVVVVVTARPQYQKIAAVCLPAQPAKSLVEVIAAAHHRRTCRRNRCAVSIFPQTNVLIGRGRCRAGEKEYGQEQKQNRGPGTLRRIDSRGHDFGGHAARTIYRVQRSARPLFHPVRCGRL